MASTVTCGYADSNWELNSEGENACQVYAELQGVCNSSFVIATAHSTDPPYLPPNNACGCNVVAYNLMGGCAWCQTGILTGWWLTIDQWVGNCTQSMYNPTGIPSNISTTGINIPAWARIIPSGTTWSPSQASRAAVPSSSTTTDTGFTFTTGGGLSPSTTSRFTSGDSFANSSVSYLSGGAAAGIAIGVILGIWALSTLVVIFVYITRQNKRKAWYGPLAAFYSGNHGGAGYGPPGQAAPLMYSPHMGSYSPGHSPPISGGGYQAPSMPGATAPTNYVPPPPEGNHQGFPGTGGAPAWGGVGNTTSMYGGSQTALSHASGPQPTQGNVPPGGYHGHAEIY